MTVRSTFMEACGESEFASVTRAHTIARQPEGASEAATCLIFFKGYLMCFVITFKPSNLVIAQQDLGSCWANDVCVMMQTKQGCLVAVCGICIYSVVPIVVRSARSFIPIV